jgi:pimeloyl-ACP methyl ester carboxylesterase
MTPTDFYIAADGLTESASITLASSVQCVSVQTDLISEPITTTYVCKGKGTSPLVLLHGFDSSVMEFRRLLPRLAEHKQSWAIDLLGFGFTERPDGVQISPEAIQQHLYAFWQTMIQRPMVLVGASMGGAAAIQFALSFPDAVEKLVLLDSAGYNDGPAIGRFLIDPLGYLVTEKFLRQPKVRQKISENAYYDPSFASLDAQRCASLHLECKNWSQALISFTRSGGYRSLRSQLSHLKILTLILWGASDRILGIQDAPRLKQAIVNSQLIWVPECGHVPHLEKPSFTAEAILNFLD